MITADDAWDRALDYGTPLEEPGDRALRTALTFHGSVANGGLLNAVQMYRDDEEFPLDAAIGAFEYFGLPETARLIQDCDDREEQAQGDEDTLEALEEEFDPQYALEDDELSEALAVALRERPVDFAPAS
ncbi:MAG: hypothetical protein Q4G34_07535 [Micrococcus sp.]|nr:hypothetical protein [Micrococcus sp.]